MRVVNENGCLYAQSTACVGRRGYDGHGGSEFSDEVVCVWV